MASGQDRKNIVVISLDDAVSYWHYKTVFREVLQTPNFDRVCAQSTAFLSAYCQSPLCGPSRSSFMSGRAPPQTGVYDNKTSIFDVVPPQKMWPYLLKENGYFCSSGGKVHHGYKPLPKPIHKVLYSDERKGFRIDKKLPAHKAQKRLGGHAGGIVTTDPADDGYYHDAHSAQSFERFITEYKGDAPFYREVGFYGPHAPFITPLRYKEMYPDRFFVKPAEWGAGFSETDFTSETMVSNFDVNDQRWRRSVRNYFAAYTHVDHYLGKVWNTLKTSRFADNTVVVILSDHGMHLGDRARFRKSTLWEQVCAVPLIIHDPSRADPQVRRDPVALIDLGPTVLDYSGLPPLDNCVGRSLRPKVEGAAPDPDRPVPTFHNGSVAVRAGDYRMIQYEDGNTEFYDVTRDWWQTKDLGRHHPDFNKVQDILIETARAYGMQIEKRPAFDGQYS
ncbi:DUF229 domain-containing protein [Aliishimia ponticola]|uniref:DUF229 domain-containing protein n=1 Tax=Aliishimia ponticola TaxID=2499833 RepID=A0A4S4N7H8_9RHOB|nr:sulfatase-like hydrolase/transferase [Aliishimia ponticola]THH34257.1 DUF229 domain-containing protein [Aliishimia ponticola]